MQKKELETGLTSPSDYNTNRPRTGPQHSSVLHIPTSMIPRPDMRPDYERDPVDGPPPDPYYWDRNPSDVSTFSIWRKAYHYAHYYGAKALDKGEAIGGVVADVCGFTQSHYQYVIDSLEQQERRRQESARVEDQSKN